MKLHIPESFIEVEEKPFWSLLDTIDWRRDAFSDGEYYEAIGLDRRVAVHTKAGRYYIDPKFFKPGESILADR